MEFTDAEIIRRSGYFSDTIGGLPLAQKEIDMSGGGKFVRYPGIQTLDIPLIQSPSEHLRSHHIFNQCTVHRSLCYGNNAA